MKLKGCPFCGDENSAEVVGISHYFTNHTHYTVYCDNCAAAGPIIPLSNDFEISWPNRRAEAQLDAIQQWNERH